MQDYPTDPGGMWTYLIPLVIVGLVILRNARARRVRMERLWIGPAILTLMAGLTISANPPSGAVAIAIDLLALVAGGALGWWRGRASRFTVDPETHFVTSRVSPAGMLLILGIFVLRYGVRYFAKGEATALHLNPMELTDAFLLLAVGMVFVQRIEWFIRARRMIADSKAAKAAA